MEQIGSKLMAKSSVTQKVTITVNRGSVEHQILEKLKGADNNLSIAKSLLVAATNYYFHLLEDEVSPAKALEAANSLTGKSQVILMQNSLPYAATMSILPTAPLQMWQTPYANPAQYPFEPPTLPQPPAPSQPLPDQPDLREKASPSPNPQQLEAEALTLIQAILDEAATAKNTDIQFYVSLSTRLKATCPENESDWNDSTWELYDQAFAAISTAEQQNILK